MLVKLTKKSLNCNTSNDLQFNDEKLHEEGTTGHFSVDHPSPCSDRLKQRLIKWKSRVNYSEQFHSYEDWRTYLNILYVNEFRP